MRAFLLAMLLLTSLNAGLFINTEQDQVRGFRRMNEHRILDEYVKLLAIPNVASDTQNIRRNAAFIVEMMKRRGLEPKLLETIDPNVPPAVFAEWNVTGAKRTVLFYAHYDGQPTDPKQWT